MGRLKSRNKNDRIKRQQLSNGLGDGEMSKVDRIKSPPKETYSISPVFKPINSHGGNKS